jgi:hypothetical protein
MRDLEPPVSRTGSGERIVDLLHVNCARSFVGVIRHADRNRTVLERVRSGGDIWVNPPFKANRVTT